MDKLVVDDSLRDKLGAIVMPIQICDQSGRVLGDFVPARQSPSISRPEDGCPYSEEELRKMRSEKGGRPLAEIWKSLGRT